MASMPDSRVVSAALKLGELRLQRVAAMEIIGAVGDDEQHPGRMDVAGQ
jgi:hypothetical protein